MSTITGLFVPKWGMTMDEGTLTEWLVNEGDEVSAGTAIASMESSKISGEIEADEAGVLAKQVLSIGETAPVGALVGVIAGPDTPAEDIDQFVSEHSSAAPEEAPEPSSSEPAKESTKKQEPAPKAEKPAPAPKAKKASKAPAGKVNIPQELRGFDSAPATEHALDLARKHDIKLSAVTPTGRADRVTVADLVEAVKQAGGSLTFGNDRERVDFVPHLGDDADVPATEHARDKAEELGVNLRDCRPTGRAGRVTVDDVMAAHSRLHADQQGTSTDATAPVPTTSEIANSAHEVPMSNMRQVIAQRLKESYLESPHFRVTAHANIDKLLAFRRDVNAQRRDLKVSVNDLVVAAVARALVAVPEMNAQFDAEQNVIRQFEHADISVAVATEEGLITPIVTHADTRTISDISRTMVDLATRAKAGQLKPDEFQGGTFSVSNLGMFGVSHFDAIINPPQVAILAVGSAQRQFVPDDNGEPVAATLLPLTVSADHRVIDGATNARFAAELTRLLESPSLIVV